MQPRTLAQIISELDPTYQPQIDNIRTQQAAIPGQIQAQEQGLQAKQNDAFGSIMDQSRARGVGFSGIPLGEQARYTGSTYLPALANLRTAGVQQATSLSEAINQINERKNTFGQHIYGQEQDRAEQQRQFNAQMEAQRQQQAEARAAASRASAASNAGLASLFGGGGDTPAGGGQQNHVNVQDAAYQSVQKFINGNDQQIRSDYAATLKSANRGNQIDQFKVQLYRQTRPDLFSTDAAAYNTPNQAPSINWRAAAKKPASGVSNFVTKPGGGNLSTGNLMNNLKGWF